MPAVSVMFKPASSLCNMRCEYCFYHSLAEQREVPFKGMMTEELFAIAMRGIFAYADGAPVSISFQGGEPLLAGKEFFRAAEKILDETDTKGAPLFVGVQTNGTLVDEEWCDIFARNGWLVGLSLDGDEAANAYRVYDGGKPAFGSTLAAVELMKKRGVEFNILAVLTRRSAERIDCIYAFFKRQGFKHLQFIPVLRPFGDEGGDMYLTGDIYGRYLCRLFDLYKRDMIRGEYVSVRQLDNFVALANMRPAEQCGMRGGCSRQLVIEGDGSAYPCDFYCVDEYLLGNIASDGVAELFASPAAARFLEEGRSIPDKCKACRWFALCRGGCRRERLDLDKCAAYDKFFSYAISDLRRMS